MKTTTRKLFFSLAVGSVVLGLVLAGSLDPPGSPAPTMVTLQQISNAIQPVDTCFDNVGRFADCGNGTVKDTVMGLIWLKNANCFGPKNWAAANIAAAQLANGQCGLTDGSAAGAWRLPTQAEWQAILRSSCDPALPGKFGESGDCYAANPWASGVQCCNYWSSSTTAGSPRQAHHVFLNYNGGTGQDGKTVTYPYVWPVRGGQ